MIAYVLNKNISGEKILKDIQDLVTKFKQQNQEKSLILYIDIKTISTEDTTLIPKIEHKNISPDCIT